MMRHGRLYRVEPFHTSGTSESERLKVTALNLFHPTVSPPFSEDSVFSYYGTVSLRSREPSFYILHLFANLFQFSFDLHHTLGNLCIIDFGADGIYLPVHLLKQEVHFSPHRFFCFQ